MIGSVKSGRVSWEFRPYLLNGLDVRLAQETGMPIVVADNPLHSVAIGGGQCLEEFEVLKDVLLSSTIR